MILEVPSSYKTPDGIWHHHIRQSDLVTFAQCPELHRRQMLGTTVGDEGDLAIVGSSCHEAYAVATREIMQGNDFDFDWLRAIAFDYLANAWLSAVEQETLRQVQVANIEEAGLLVTNCLTYWFEGFKPWLEANANSIESVEQRFDIKVWEDYRRVLYLTGTWDLGLKDHLLDYKHSQSQKYSKQKAWQLSRYHPQATHYVWAHDMLTYDSNTLLYALEDQLASFSFVNINPEKGIEIIGPQEGLVIRTVGDCLFHLEQMKSLAYLIEAELPVWPLGPNDWWCSSKWCPAWNDCRGRYIGEDPWGLLAKAETELDKRR